MKKLLVISIFIPVLCFAQNEYLDQNTSQTTIHTSIVIQRWKYNGVDDAITEGAFPINVNYSPTEKINLQFTNTPAVSRFGDANIAGLSDTWLRGSYSINEQLMVALGLGLPTGVTEYENEDRALAQLLSNNVLRFQVPLFGQGFNMSTGVIYAYPFNEQLVFGSGLNFVHRGKFKYLKERDFQFNPGDQFGFNIGLNYDIRNDLRLNFDILYTFYMNDKLDETEIYGASSKFGLKSGLIYRKSNKIIRIVSRLRTSGKNETWDGVTLITEDKNSSNTQREIEAEFCLILSELYSVSAMLDIRSYVENEYNTGQADVFGIGVSNSIQFMPNLILYGSLKLFFGDTYYKGSVPKVGGSEFRIGTTYKL